MFDFIERIKDFNLRKEHTDMLIRAWKTENKKVYSDFVRRIEAVKKGDMSIITEMMDVAKNCVPEEVRVFHNWLGDVLNGKVKMADITQSILQESKRLPDGSFGNTDRDMESYVCR